VPSISPNELLNKSPLNVDENIPFFHGPDYVRSSEPPTLITTEIGGDSNRNLMTSQETVSAFEEHASYADTHSLPHGLLPRKLFGLSLAAHNDVIQMRHQAACESRLELLRSLVQRGTYEESIDLSFALRNEDRTNMHSSCQGDQPFVGEASLITSVATPGVRMGLRHERANSSTSIMLHDINGRNASTWYLALNSFQLRGWAPAEFTPVVGFTLDNYFVLAESSVRCEIQAGSEKNRSGATLLCSGGSSRDVLVHSAEDAAHFATNVSSSVPHRRLSMQMLVPEAQLDRESRVTLTSNYVVGTKTILVIIACPSDSVNCATQSYPYGYCFGVIQVHYYFDIFSYFCIL
jgi:hypothetical protein